MLHPQGSPNQQVLLSVIRSLADARPTGSETVEEGTEEGKASCGRLVATSGFV